MASVKETPFRSGHASCATAARDAGELSTEEGKRVLDELAAVGDGAGFLFVSHRVEAKSVVRGGAPANEILATTREVEADLVVPGTHVVAA